jgi:hypothetical protein
MLPESIIALVGEVDSHFSSSLHVSRQFLVRHPQQLGQHRHVLVRRFSPRIINQRLKSFHGAPPFGERLLDITHSEQPAPAPDGTRTPLGTRK